MNSASSRSVQRPVPQIPHLQLVFSLAAVALFLTGCGSGGGGETGPIVTPNTAVTFFATSTANDQLSQFSITIESLTLTDNLGKTAIVMATPVSDEFIHLNGNIEPLVSVAVPQDTYVSATATVELALPACVGQDLAADEILINETLNGPGSGGVTVSLPEPITVTGTAMALALNLQVSASALFTGGCGPSLTNSVLVAPVFNLTPLTIAAQPTNGTNGKAIGLQGVIGSVDAGGSGMVVNALYAMNADHPPSWTVSLDSSTVFQGISGVSQLTAGMAVNLDLAVQADGTLLATRIAIPDANANNLAISSGPPTILPNSSQTIYTFDVEQQGDLGGLDNLYNYSNATFQVANQFTNLQSLPFNATFSAANMVEGQNIFFTSHAQEVNGFPSLPTPASTMTLLPQTINGVVSVISSDGGFTTYTVTFAPYDLFTSLAVQPGQTTLLTNSTSIVVYADSNTQMLNSSSLAVGGVFRFNGLVFDDGGTLRMDCGQIYDGVAE